MSVKPKAFHRKLDRGMCREFYNHSSPAEASSLFSSLFVPLLCLSSFYNQRNNVGKATKRKYLGQLKHEPGYVLSS